MALPTRRDSRRVLTASAVKLTRAESAYSKRTAQHWQLQALDHYDRIGELRYACHFYAKQMSRVIFFPALLSEDGKTKQPIESGAPVDILNRIQDPGGGRSQIQYRYGLLSFVTGEGVLFGYKLGTNEEAWKFLWKDEVRQRDNGDWVRLDMDKKETMDVGVGYRLWNPHPRHSDEPDSPVHAVLNICEELLILTAAVRGTATTRLTNGMLLIPTEISPNPMEVVGDEDPENNVFLADLIDHIQSQIESPGSPEAKVPPLLEGAYDYLDRVRWMPMHDPQTDYMEKDLRTEAIKRLALGLDMPPEALLGMTDANHWTAKQVQHDIWRSHGMPKAEQFADDLSEAYLKPALRDENYENWARVVIDYDDSQVVISPDRTEDADAALDRIAISREGYRVLKGIPEAMKPDDAEEEFLTALRMRNPELFAEVLGIETPQRGPLPAPQTNGNAANGPSEPSQGRVVSRQEARTASAEILGAAKMALGRCREIAGARLRRKQQTCGECQEATDGKPNTIVASILGPDQVTRLGIQDPMELVKNGADLFKEMLATSGCDSTQAQSLAQQIEVFAAKTLFEKQPTLPAGFVAAVEKAQEVSLALQS